MTAPKRRRSGRNLSEAERGTVQVNVRVPRAVRLRYEAEAERRGITLGALVRERIESAEWLKNDS